MLGGGPIVTLPRHAARIDTQRHESRTHRRLAALLAAYAPHDGRFELRLPGTYAIRLSRASNERIHGTLRPMLCLVAQGAKLIMLGRSVFEYDPSRMLVLSVDLPVAGQVLRASADAPYLCFRLDLDPVRIAELSLRVFPRGVPRPDDSRGVYVADSDEQIVEAASRLIALMSQPADAALLGPLVVDEILIRLLRSSVGTRVAQMGYADSAVQRVARAVSELRSNFSQPLKVPALARLVHMSVSSFHQHFKAVTSMSPLQYQKVLRLEEARRLMLLQSLDAQEAARAVGYMSASQFSREYARFFGQAPVRDIARLREDSGTDLIGRRGLSGTTGTLLKHAPSLASALLTLNGGAW
jgi:AraC-like DNA-binding protein